jgi:hypothetical protein
MTVTEAWEPNTAKARALLNPRGVDVVHAATDALPFPDATFDLVSSRHPIKPHWRQITRVLTDDGTYFAQHVGPASAFELIEHFLGPLPTARLARDPEIEAEDARAADLEIVQLRTARLRMQFFDIGAVVWTLRRCVWWVPDFTVERYEHQLRALDAEMRAGQPFTAHSSRTLFEARRSAR